MLSIYQNRRWDSGPLTVREIMQKGLLGDIVNYEIRYERYNPTKNKKAWKETGEYGTGLVFDLGVHLIDDVVNQFGKPQALYADIAKQNPDSGSDDYFQIHFYYPDKRVIMSTTKFAREPAPHIILQGKLGSYIKQQMDNQEALLRAGKSPQGNWNLEPEQDWGILHTEIKGTVVRQKYATVKGNYQAYYDNIYAALTSQAPLAVTTAQAVEVLKLIELAYQSNKEGRKLYLTD